MGGPSSPRQVPCLATFTQPIGSTVHSLKPIFLGLSITLIALGLAYLGLGARGVAHHEPRAVVLVGVGAGAVLVGAALWRLVRRMRDER